MLQGARPEGQFQRLGQRFGIDLMIAVERAETDVRTASAKRVGDIFGLVERQDMITSAVRNEDQLPMIDAR